MTSERTTRVLNGWLMVFVNLLLIVGGAVATVWCIAQAAQGAPAYLRWLWLTLPTVILGVLSFAGLFTLQPNEARVLTLFGKYCGTVHQSGFFWTNPLMTKVKISRRVRNLETNRLKVNDKRGNPIEI